MGHHIVGIPGSDGAGLSTPTVERSTQSISATFTSSDRLAVPPGAVETIRQSIAGRKVAPKINDRIREALALICDEAHKSQVMPEHLLVTLKDLCRALPEYERINGAREREEFLNALVTTAIEEYYRV